MTAVMKAGYIGWMLSVCVVSLGTVSCSRSDNPSEPSPFEPVPAVEQITVDAERLLVDAGTVSFLDIFVSPGDVLPLSEGMCPGLSIEKCLKTVSVPEGEAGELYRIVGVERLESENRKTGCYRVSIMGDSSLVFLRDSVRVRYDKDSVHIASGGFVLISRRSALVPVALSVSGGTVRLAPGLTARVDISVTPDSALIDIDAEGRCKGMRLGADTSLYRIARVEKSDTMGRYALYVTAAEELQTRSDDVSVILETYDAEGESDTLRSPSFVISVVRGVTALDSLKIIAGGEFYLPLGVCAGHYTFTLPPETDLTSLKASFVSYGSTVTVNGTVQISGETVNDYSKDVTYTVTSTAGNKEDYTVSVYDFDLPVVYVRTPDEIPVKSKEVWIENSRALIFDGKDVDSLGLSIRGRGNSSWSWNPKKPYALKFDSKQPLFGMPKDKRWNLLANYADRTLMRNAVAFEISRKAGLAWSPRGVYVELILNGEHLGNYYLCESVKVSKNRVNITEMKAEDITPETISGGYLLEYDMFYDEVNKFRSGVKGFPVNIKEPDEDVLVPEQFRYVRNYIDTVERSIYVDTLFQKREFSKYVDMDSFIETWLVFELTELVEPAVPRSSFFYKDRMKRLCMGPVWDFDMFSFRTGLSKFCVKDALYFGKLLTDPLVMARVKEKWDEIRASLDDVHNYIDETADLLEKSERRNNELWPLSQSSAHFNGDEKLSFREAVARMHYALRERAEWMDVHIGNL